MFYPNITEVREESNEVFLELGFCTFILTIETFKKFLDCLQVWLNGETNLDTCFTFNDPESNFRITPQMCFGEGKLELELCFSANESNWICFRFLGTKEEYQLLHDYWTADFAATTSGSQEDWDKLASINNKVNAASLAEAQVKY